MNNIKSTIKLIGSLGLSLFTCISSGQKSEILVERSKDDGSAIGLTFKDRAGKTIKELSIASLNPYRSNDQQKEIENTGKFSTLPPGRTGIHLSAETHGFVGISFEYFPFYKDDVGDVDLRESTVMIFDSTGSQFYRLDHLPFDAQRPLISEDGKYMGLYFGELAYDMVSKEIGFKIYDITANKVIYKVDANNIGGGFIQSGLFIFRIAVDREHSTYYVFDPKTEILYERTLDVEQMKLRKRFGEKGVVFVLLPNAERIEDYNGYFNVVKSEIIKTKNPR